jgi:hypothetical protein
LLWFEDFENRKVLRSAVTLQSIWDKMEKARTGMATHGGALYNRNYLSERGNVHKLIENHPDGTLITPIRKDGKPTWPEAYTPEAVKRIERAAEDFAGKYLQEPSIGADIFFDRASLDRQPKLAPRRTAAGFKLFHEFDPSHRYGSGHDIAGSVGLDSSTSVFIDFSATPNRVAATYRNNLIKPDVFADEIVRQAETIRRVRRGAREQQLRRGDHYQAEANVREHIRHGAVLRDTGARAARPYLRLADQRGD